MDCRDSSTYSRMMSLPIPSRVDFLLDNIEVSALRFTTLVCTLRLLVRSNLESKNNESLYEEDYE